MQARFHLGRVPFLLTTSLSHCHQLGNHLKCHCHQMSLNVTNCRQLKWQTKSESGKSLLELIESPLYYESTHPSTFPIALAIFCPSCLFSRENMPSMFKQGFEKWLKPPLSPRTRSSWSPRRRQQAHLDVPECHMYDTHISSQFPSSHFLWRSWLTVT